MQLRGGGCVKDCCAACLCAFPVFRRGEKGELTLLDVRQAAVLSKVREG